MKRIYTEPEDDCEDEICSNCSGSGEGMHDGSRCYVCGGSGEVSSGGMTKEEALADAADYYNDLAKDEQYGL